MSHMKMSNFTSDFLSLMDRLTTQYKNEVFWVKFIINVGEMRVEVFEEDKNIDEMMVLFLEHPATYYLKEISWFAPQMTIAVCGITLFAPLPGYSVQSEEICYIGFQKFN